VTTAAAWRSRRLPRRRCRPGVVRDGEVVDVEALAGVLRALFAEHKGLDKRVRIGVANQKIVVASSSCRSSRTPRSSRPPCSFTAADELPMPLDGAVLDWQSLEVADTPDGPRQRVLLVAGRRDMIEKVLPPPAAPGCVRKASTWPPSG
jgi:type IV pilus assembly protein PilM